MRILVTILTVFFLFASCKKEDIDYPNTSNVSCKLCTWAKSVEGKYIGLADGIDTSPTGMAYYNTQSLHDSLIVDVEQIWKEEFSPSMDSTIMVFKLTYTMQSDSTKHFYKVIYFNSSKGSTIQSSVNTYDILENNTFKSYKFINGKFQVLFFQYVGHKIQ